MESVASVLKEAGFLVRTPQLAGHETVAKLDRTRWQDWYHSLVASFDDFASPSDPCFYVGLSMGALLGLKLAADFPSRIRALALLGTPLKLDPILENLIIPAVRYTPLRFFVRSVAKNYDKSVADPKGKILYQKNSLERFPASSVFELQKLIRETKKNLPRVTQPILMIHGSDDRIAFPSSCEVVRKWVGSKVIEWSVQKKMKHVLPLDFEHHRTAMRIFGFFKGCLKTV